jgi:hypothetical protein
MTTVVLMRELDLAGFEADARGRAEPARVATLVSAARSAGELALAHGERLTAAFAGAGDTWVAALAFFLRAAAGLTCHLKA